MQLVGRKDYAYFSLSLILKGFWKSGPHIPHRYVDVGLRQKKMAGT